LSILPSELLSSIDVTKSLRADMDADALGGTVNLHILAAPSERKIIGVLEGEYADLTNDFANYKVVGGFSDRFFNDKIGVNAKLSLEQKQMPSQQFSGGYSGPAWNFTTNSDGEIIDSTLFVRTQKTSLIDKQQTRKRTNASLILDYKKDWWKVKLLNVYSQKDDFIVTRNNTYVFNPGGNPSNFTLDLNETDWKTGILMHNLMNEFQFGNSKIDLVLATTYAKQTQEDQSFPFVEINNYNLDQNSLIYRQPTSIIDEVGGPGGLNIDDTFLRQLAIGNRELIDRNYDLRLDYEYSFRWKDVISGKFKVGGKYHELVRTSNGTQQSSNIECGGGVARQQSVISKFPWIQTDVGAQRGINAANFIDENYNPGPFLNDRFDLGWTADADLLTDIQEGYYTGQVGDPNYFLNGVASFVRDYAANEKLTAGFMMTELNIGKKLMLMPGIRYEKNQTEYAAFQIKTNSGQTGIEPNPEEVTINRENAFWFPSLNLKYALTDAVTIQGASYKSASRPSFRQISPLVIYPTSGNFIQSNNPYLTPAIAWNFDLGASFNTNKSGLITVYAFYKEINDLIFVLNGYQPNKKGSIVGAPADLDDRILGGEYYDEFFLNNNGRTNLPFNNPEKAYVKGLEISWQTNFWYLPGLLKGLVFDVNYTILNTQTKYPFFQSVQTGVDSSGFIPIPIFSQQYNTRKGQMEDQPTSILNVILGWDYKGFSSRISYRFQSQTVEGLDSRYSLFDRFYDSFSLLDLTLKQKITKNISAYVNFKNINRQIDDYFFDEQQENPALPTNSQSYGMRIQFGGRMNF
jgi:TonB-dependent receptor